MHLEIRDVRRTFGGVHAVREVSLRVERGEFLGFLGPSGSGKTTTLRIVAGFEQPDAGAVLLDGRDITHVRPQHRNMGMVFQSYALFPNMTAAQNVAFGLRIRRQAPNAIRRRTEELLGMVGLSQKAGRLPHQLSGGEQQRVALARALAPSPEVLLLDEPLSALDARIRVALRGEIRRIQRALGITTLYVTHDQEEALAISDRVVVFHDGRVEQVGSPREVYERPQTAFVAEFVGTTNRLLGTVDNPATGACSIEGRRIYLEALPDGAAAGAAIEIRVRPERIALGADIEAGSNAMDGVVADVVYLGGHTLVQVRIGTQELWIDRAHGSGQAEPRPGETIRFRLPAAAVVDRCQVSPHQVSAATGG